MKVAIEVDAAGQLHVTGDAILGNKIAVLGMLELAKVAVLQNPAAQQPGIAVPNQSLTQQLLKDGGSNRN